MRGYLILETGEVFIGRWQGGRERAGEVVFNTSHSGYEEIATDPSYFRQLVVMTAPMQGNYGSDPRVWESQRIWIDGFICLEIQDSLREHSWKQCLIENQIPLLSEVDTRKLVQRLRQGAVWGALVQAASEDEAQNRARSLIELSKKVDGDWVFAASRKEVETRSGERPSGPRVAVLDFGSKENILRELQKRCSEIRIFNSRTPADVISSYKPDALMLTNGPGDPADVKVAVETVRQFIGVKPIFGICMGHQILALALGARTYKLKFGHRGGNHPVRDTLLNQVYMTSQNHGYAVEESSLPEEAQVTHVNLNDGTVAGFYSEKKRYLGIQYHPESCPGPKEATGLFSFFIERMI